MDATLRAAITLEAMVSECGERACSERVPFNFRCIVDVPPKKSRPA